MFKRIPATARIAFGLASLSLSILMAADWLRLIPDPRPAVLRGRSQFCETVAINTALLARRGQTDALAESLRAAADRHPELLSLAIRRGNGQLLTQWGDHAAHWSDSADHAPTMEQMLVPIHVAQKRWGALEATFKPVGAPGWGDYVTHPMLLLSLFVLPISVAAYYFFLRRVLVHLNPSKVVPPRVRAALDSLTEGLLLLDGRERIVLANQAFAKTAGCGAEKLLGRRPSDLRWRRSGVEGELAASAAAPLPWSLVLEDGQPRTGMLLSLDKAGEGACTYVVNATPVEDQAGVRRGVLASFEDVTPLEEKKAELSTALSKLKLTSEEVRRQNTELEVLATRDPLTSCLNRRAFFERFETLWKVAHRHHQPLSCVLVDIDLFKQINDRHGHSVGDQVLQEVARILRATTRECDLTCRYGGEEFALVFPNTEQTVAVAVAERIRAALAATPCGPVSVTASLGVAALGVDGADPQALLDQADTCLYAAKRNGRNRVVHRDQMSPEALPAPEEANHGSPPAESEPDASIPFHAVTALVSALAYRDRETAEHSRRVADLCVATAEGLMSHRDAYVLEIAALLHDIGKIGVPDSILLKPSQLTPDEWKIMERHDRIGIEILRASFRCDKLSRIVENYGVFFAGSSRADAILPSDAVPLGARILAIADAYDAMVTDRVYRAGRTPDEAFAELRRCAGTQFDPELTEHFIHCLRQKGPDRGSPTAVSKHVALDIGLQLERLMLALENHDRAGLQALAGRLKSVAAKHEIAEIALKTSDLEHALELEADFMTVLQTAGELMELCRATQGAFINADDAAGPEWHPMEVVQLACAAPAEAPA